MTDLSQPAPASTNHDVLNRLLAVHKEVAKVIVGQDSVLWGLTCALLVRGHVLVEGVPGVAKTLLVKTFAQATSLDFNRVQFTADLTPGDLIGRSAYDSNGTLVRFDQGAVFTNFLLADEIVRTSPKTQAALLEAMEESQVSVAGRTYPLADPFITIATQNPIEHQDTHPLPVAQLDRFLFKLIVDYPEDLQEYEILKRHHRGLDPQDVASAGVEPVATPGDILAAQKLVEQVRVEEAVIRYIADLCRETRISSEVGLGASPRGAAALLQATKAWAWLAGRSFVTPDEVKVVAYPALRHRLLLGPELRRDSADVDEVLASILDTVPVPR